MCAFQNDVLSSSSSSSSIMLQTSALSLLFSCGILWGPTPASASSLAKQLERYRDQRNRFCEDLRQYGATHQHPAHVDIKKRWQAERESQKSDRLRLSLMAVLLGDSPDQLVRFADDLQSEERRHRNERKRSSETLYTDALLQGYEIEGKAATHLCDPRHYSPHVAELNDRYGNFTCQQLCSHCELGSFAVCLDRRPGYSGLGSSCLCTYSQHQPLKKFALAIKDKYSDNRNVATVGASEEEDREGERRPRRPSPSSLFNLLMPPF